MDIVKFSKKDQKETSKFMDKIWDEMGEIDEGWKKKPKDGFSHLDKFFHMPTEGFLLLIKDKGKIIGTGGCVKLNSTDALLKRFYIDKTYRGTGIAGDLLTAIVSATKELELSRIVIDVSKDNVRAIRFYEKNGFVKYDQSPDEKWRESKFPDVFDYFFLSI